MNKQFKRTLINAAVLAAMAAMAVGCGGGGDDGGGGDNNPTNNNPTNQSGNFISSTNATQALDIALVAEAVTENHSNVELGTGFRTQLTPIPAVGVVFVCDVGTKTTATFSGGDSNANGAFDVGETMSINFDAGSCDISGFTTTGGNLKIKYVTALPDSYEYKLSGIAASVGTTPQKFSGIMGDTQSGKGGDRASKLDFVWDNKGDTITVTQYARTQPDITKARYKVSFFVESIVLGAIGPAGQLTVDYTDDAVDELQVKAPDGSKVFLNCPGGFGAGACTYSVNGGPSIAYTPPS